MFKHVRKKLLKVFNNEIHNKGICNLYCKKSYSQCGEDLLVQYVFSLRSIKNPTYLDIGANDPFYLSNTALFYESGCRGINIEANPSLIDQFYKQRPGDLNLNIGIGIKEDLLDFYVMDDSTLGSFSKSECEKYIKTGRYKLKEIIKVRVTTIKKIINEYCNGQFPDFLSIDAEGMDYDILKTIDFEQCSPKVICVEAAEYSPTGSGGRRIELINFLIYNGYYEYANTNLNAIMVKKSFWFI